MISLGRGYFEFSFSSAEDLRSVWSIGQWNLKPGLLRLFSWSQDFNPKHQNQTNAQCWVRIYGLPQEYWRPKIVFTIAGGLGIPICLDEATSKRTFGHFARVLVDIDLNSNLQNRILVDRDDFAFFVDVEYKRLPDFCTSCQNIGHSLANCKRKQGNDSSNHQERVFKPARKIYVPKHKDNIQQDGLDPSTDDQQQVIADNSEKDQKDHLVQNDSARHAQNQETVDPNPLLGFVTNADQNLVQEPVSNVEYISVQSPTNQHSADVGNVNNSIPYGRSLASASENQVDNSKDAVDDTIVEDSIFSSNLRTNSVTGIPVDSPVPLIPFSGRDINTPVSTPLA